MSTIKKLVSHSSMYMTGEVIVMAGGLVSFPIIARLLSTQEYGIMVLISTTVGLMQALSTAGLHHASQRFYSKYKKIGKIESFHSTLIFGSLVFGFIGTLCMMLVFMALTHFRLVSGNIQGIFFIASSLIAIRIMTSLFGSLYRIQEKPQTYISFSILNKYLGLALIILFLLAFSWGLFGYYLGLFIGELTVLIIYWSIIIREINFPLKEFSFPMLRQARAYGLPLVFYGIAGALLTSSDRYLIGYFMTKSDIALYSVPYNLCSYLGGILVTGFEFAYIPIIMNEWNQGYFDKVRLGVQRIIRLYCLVAFPLFAGIFALGREIIVLFASDKYSEAHYILPYILGGVMIQGLLTPLMIGLVLSNSTKQIAKLTWKVTILNILMNLVLIPKIGLYGAALSTLVCYMLLAIAGAIRSSKHFLIGIPYFPITLYGLATLLMYGALNFVSTYSYMTALYTRICFGALLYAIIIVLFDRKCRVSIVIQIQSFSRKIRG
jgi:O-antigen/teichoic acid export membrane protein